MTFNGRQLIRLRAERYVEGQWDVITRFEWAPLGRPITKRGINSRLRALEQEFPLHDVEVLVLRDVKAYGAHAKYRTAADVKEGYFVVAGDCIETARDYAEDTLRRHRKATKIDRLTVWNPDHAPAELFGTEVA